MTLVWKGDKVRPLVGSPVAEFYEEQIAKLGPDPLREDADRELLWASMQKAKTPVGLVLMQQDKVAGIGNIYRAEILFKARGAAFVLTHRMSPWVCHCCGAGVWCCSQLARKHPTRQQCLSSSVWIGFACPLRRLFNQVLLLLWVCSGRLPLIP